MAFFPRTLYNTEASFTPLFRLLEDFDSYSRQGSQCGPSSKPASRRSAAAATGLSHWQPKFDVRETGENYELHGELPGLSKEDISIEFTEPQTLVVRGKVERSYSAGSDPSAPAVEQATPASSVTEGGEDAAAASAAAAKAHSRQASVADEDENSAQESGFEVVEEPKSAAPAEPKKPADKAKYWLSERSIGEFSRSFSFPSRVDQDEVTAAFENGILSISVPKAKKHESRRIAVL